MTPFPEDDTRLSQFLKQNQPPVPSPAPELEERILALVEAESLPGSPRRDRRRIVWLIPSTIAAAFVATFIGYQALVPPKPTAAELSELEAFIESTWQDAVTEPSTEPIDNSLFPPTEDSAVN